MKIVSAYTVLLLIIFISHFFFPDYKQIIIPLSLFTIAFIFCDSFKINFRMKDFLLTIKVSALFLGIPAFFTLFFLKKFSIPSLNFVIYLFIAVAIPEELFFRGFIQEKLGNDKRGIIVASLLFSIAHIPNILINHNLLSLLTFFPSIIMGWLYMKTSNLLTPIIFHFLSDIFFFSVIANFMLK